MARRHPPDGLACGREAADDVDGQHAAHLLGGQVLDAAAAADDTGIVDEGADGAELPVDLANRPTTAPSSALSAAKARPRRPSARMRSRPRRPRRDPADS